MTALAEMFAVGRSVSRMRKGKSAIGSRPAESARAAQDAFIADADGDLLAIEIFEQRNGKFA